ncbi:flagellar hook protein FlgE [Roseococcus sp. DSY-14]|uniref:flagellar hook protein FlgE n=1 Tax=Roseococcus sp. DSY-14 TaxID=3369650 RepID=UPI00387B6EB2
MSLFGSMTTAISGLAAQARALGHVSDNLANSQTVGFKRVDTNFSDLVTQSNATIHSPGSVLARPDFTNTVQGTVEQTSNPLGMAIGGQGFFAVAQARGTVDGLPTFDDRQFFTRAGDFSMDADGYLVNSSGYYLRGWRMQDNGQMDRTTLNPIRVSQNVFNPIATTTIEMSANLPALTPPASPAEAKSYSTQVEVYDDMGRRHAVTLTFAQDPGAVGPPAVPAAANTWRMSVNPPPTSGAVDIPVVFGADGTINSFDGVAGTTNDPVTLTLNMGLGVAAQDITLNLGRFNLPEGLTQWDATDFSLRNLEQNGVPPGGYSGLSIGETGDIMVNYDNGQSRVIGRVPLVAFADPDRLQRIDGQAFMRTLDSGEARVTDASSNGVGKLVVGALEKSNVDIAAEFTKLIVAQRAYTANTKVVTTADEMLQETINMRR